MEREEIIAIVAEEMEQMIAADPSRFQGPPGVDGDSGYMGAMGANGRTRGLPLPAVRDRSILAEVDMINGMTVEEYNAKEQRRGSIVAKLHGYTPFDEGDTEESLKAEHLALTGEAYRTQEEEVAEQAAAQRERRDVEEQARLDADLQIISDAVAEGFMDCKAVRDALGFDGLKPNGAHYDSVGVAYRFIGESGEKIVPLIPNDGRAYYINGERKKISLALRTGIWPDAFAEVESYKYKWDADRVAREQKSWDDAQQAKDEYDQSKAEELAGLIARQEADRAQRAVEQAERHAQLDAARDAEIRLLIAEAEAADTRVMAPERKEQVMAKLRSYVAAGLPLNRNGLPKRKLLNEHAGEKIEGWEKRECWPETQGD